MRARTGILRTGLRCVLAAAAVLGLAFAGLLALDSLAPPVSTLMLGRLVTGSGYERSYVPLSAIAPVALAAVVTSEDARFCRNGGVDWDSLREVMDDPDGPSRGASTITMQTAKNLFLWPGRSSLRKGIEIGIALLLGRIWTKAHVLEVYLNVAEWGDGLFGIEAAAQTYFGKSARDLTAGEAALLATSLPNPRERDAGNPEPFQRRLAATLAARARGSGEWLDCLPHGRRAPAATRASPARADR